ncbi:glycoside hydrolase superfamily [Talaromyces proteolyticus]|uniref:Glycoside hydrolase superfamily n=1 Tax=Talaromyces proteolyticus TaxID=1131652 RepID=A0AAD4KNL8_9EURO|nr:glycoside hydrolase superfamily [Talaromyces proteolyticus]KAH8696748.1 glycoside hydrolase superfamily [Talaromyces proteolyticus]
MSGLSCLIRRCIVIATSTILLMVFLLQIDYLKLIESLPHQTPAVDPRCDGQQHPLSSQALLYPGCKNNDRLGSIPSTPALFNYTLPLRTRGRDIVDARGQRVKLASINWYGASDVGYIPAGLDAQHRDDIAKLIRSLGFNSVRLPYADEIVRDNPWIPAEKLSANRDLVRPDGRHSEEGEGALARDVFTAVVQSLTDAGIMVIVNNHITQATWCCGANPCDAVWNNDWFGGSLFCRVSQTEQQWISNWETTMHPLISNPGVIGVDLRNEPRGLWGTLSWDDWAGAAETAAHRLLTLNPDWLIVVEGISSANDLSGVRTRPIELPPGYADRVVYSAHVYSWSGWGALRPYSGRTYSDFATSMRKNWAFIIEENLAPVWIGEFGTADHPNSGDRNYWNNLISFLGDIDVSWGYWALNPRKPAGWEWEGYGLVGDGWDEDSVRRDYRLNDLYHLGLRPELAS